MTEPALTIELLGGLRIRQNDRILAEFPPQQSSLLLAYLALHVRRSFTREEIVEALLPDLDAETGRHRLRQYLHGLRQELAACSLTETPLLLATRDHLRLNPEAARVDVILFEENLRAASAADDAQERIRLLNAALALYQGELLPGFYEESIDTERRRLADLRHHALLSLATAYKQAGDLTRALERIREVIALDPLQEEAHCEAMRLYAATGQPAAAQRQYQRLVSLLREELDVEPSAETQQLMQSMRANGKESAAAPAESPSSVTPFAPPPSVPSSAPAEKPSPVASSPRLSRPWRLLAPRLLPYEGRGGSLRFFRPWRLVLMAGVLALSAFGLVRGLRTRPHSPASHPSITTPPPVAAPTPSVTSNANTGLPPFEYGMEVWARRIELLPGDRDSEPTAIALDDRSNVYVTGFVETEKQDVDMVTMKYSPLGKLFWQRRYNGPKNDCDRARSVTVDNMGNAYITGDSYNGDWDKGGTDYDVVTIRYDADGVQKWARRYDGPAHRADGGVKVALDGAGNVYVGAHSLGLTVQGIPREDIAILKYDRGGALKWARRHNETGKHDDYLNAMTTDKDGNVFVTGTTTGNDTRRSVVTLKYDPNGVLQWHTRYHGPHDDSDGGRSIRLDPRGNVYVLGTVVRIMSDRLVSMPNFLLLKYDPEGKLKWSRVYPDQIWEARPTGLGIDSVGNVVVGGVGGYALEEILTVAYDTNGKQRWAQSVGKRRDAQEKVNGFNTATGVIVDSGYAYVTGTLFNGKVRDGKPEREYATLQYDMYGNLQWLRMFPGLNNGAWGIGTAIAAQGRIFVTGQSQDRPDRPGRSIVTVKY